MRQAQHNTTYYYININLLSKKLIGICRSKNLLRNDISISKYISQTENKCNHLNLNGHILEDKYPPDT
jgi:hypothetical protein